MNNSNQKNEYSNKLLYEFFATNYDISDLAARIELQKQSQMSFFNLKKMVQKSNIA